MSAKRKPDLHLESAHVLFMDVVGYSKLLVNEQREVVRRLNQIVRIPGTRNLLDLFSGDSIRRTAMLPSSTPMITV